MHFVHWRVLLTGCKIAIACGKVQTWILGFLHIILLIVERHLAGHHDLPGFSVVIASSLLLLRGLLRLVRRLLVDLLDVSGLNVLVAASHGLVLVIYTWGESSNLHGRALAIVLARKGRSV